MAHVVIVGAGAAGLFAAGSALEGGHRVTLAEHSGSPGKKLLITGKGRCNVTSDSDERAVLQNVRRNPRFLYSSLYGMPPAEVKAIFEGLGVPLKTERGRRVFPVSDRAADVLDALLRRAAGAQMVAGDVQRVLVRGQRAAGVQLHGGREIEADAVLLATGGVSYPVTGSTGDGYRMAKALGHSIVPPVPSLVSLKARGEDCARMMGLSLRNVALRLLEDDVLVFHEQGEMLFTHFGLSGPLTLSASAYIGELAAHRYTAEIDLKPALSAEQLDARLQRDFAEFAARDTAHSLDRLLPAKMRPVMLARWGVDPHKKAAHITREERARLAVLIKAFRVEIKGRGDLDHAVITSGGVDVKEVDPKTMGSKLVPGLYFAGEILDVDAYTGGYNLQIAWCTAHAAARALDAL